MVMALAVSLVCQAADVMPLAKGTRLNGSTPTNGAVVVTGTVFLPPPCQINGDQSVNVEFGDIRTDLIDGETYGIQTVPANITCDSTPSGQLQVRLNGVPDAKGSGILRTSVEGLGIRMMHDGVDFPLNTAVDVTQSGFTLTAVPTTTDSKHLAAGEFTASATLVLIQD
nr:fimbrial protein [Enterobacter asburiae]